MNPFEDYLPATYALIKQAGSLEAMIAALPYQSGADPLMEVPVLTDAGNVAVRDHVLADIVALATGGGLHADRRGRSAREPATGGSAIPIGHPFSDILAALSTQSGAERLSLIPALIGSTAFLFAAEDIAALSAPGTAGFLNFTIDGTLVGNSDSLIPTEQAVKTYVDTAINGRTWKLQEVRARTTRHAAREHLQQRPEWHRCDADRQLERSPRCAGWT